MSDMKTFRIFNAITDETIIFIKAKDIAEASNWVFRNYGAVSTVDIEEV